eukprot:124570-Hanusia_phi.AAC.4
MSEFVIMVERNLGYEAEHHQPAFNGIPMIRFRVDHKAQRYGILTTHEIKHAMCTMLNTVLRERRLHLCDYFVSRDPKGMKRRLREQLEIYSYQFKSAASVFNKDQLALSGKVGGMKHDVAIALQLVVYYSSNPEYYRVPRPGPTPEVPSPDGPTITGGSTPASPLRDLTRGCSFPELPLWLEAWSSWRPRLLRLLLFLVTSLSFLLDRTRSNVALDFIDHRLTAKKMVRASRSLPNMSELTSIW